MKPLCDGGSASRSGVATAYLRHSRSAGAHRHEGNGDEKGDGSASGYPRRKARQKGLRYGSVCSGIEAATVAGVPRMGTRLVLRD